MELGLLGFKRHLLLSLSGAVVSDSPTANTADSVINLCSVWTGTQLSTLHAGHLTHTLQTLEVCDTTISHAFSHTNHVVSDHLVELSGIKFDLGVFERIKECLIHFIGIHTTLDRSRGSSEVCNSTFTLLSLSHHSATVSHSGGVCILGLA